ncbi:hypothetical protein A3Q56_01073 [Intoshia linei]|uniref:Uncharacterized protein n=1 Tax=Intoshia linei TaxID=1819745 RepID=A0A177BAE5_9BILA|nr:hypothetical protein A3Q56_01073 [Intoshia linei]
MYPYNTHFEYTEEDNLNTFQHDRMKSEINQEILMSKLLSQSINDIKNSLVNDDYASNTNKYQMYNEPDYNKSVNWKEKHFKQYQYNQRLEKESIQLSEKLFHAKMALKQRKENGKHENSYNYYNNYYKISKHRLHLLEKQKLKIFGELRDLERRLDGESAAYHRAKDALNEKVVELNAIADNIERVQNYQRNALAMIQSHHKQHNIITDKNRKKEKIVRIDDTPLIHTEDLNKLTNEIDDYEKYIEMANLPREKTIVKSKTVPSKIPQKIKKKRKLIKH